MTITPPSEPYDVSAVPTFVPVRRRGDDDDDAASGSAMHFEEKIRP